MASIPQPPLGSSNDELHKTLSDLITFIRERFENGTKTQSYTQEQLDSFTDLSWLGTIVYNSNAGENYVSYLDGSEVNWRATYDA